MKLIVILLAITACVSAAESPSASRLLRPHTDIHKHLYSSGDEFIVDGQDAVRYQIPYQASLRWSQTNANYRHICGGTLISTTRVLTAAHCKPYNIGSYLIVLGQLIQNETHSDIQTFKIGGFTDEFVVHPDYRGGVAPNDIAVIKLPHAARITRAVKPAHLPHNRDCNLIQMVLLSGWGLTNSSNKETPKHLQWVDVPRITNEDCANRLRSILGSSEPLDNTMICTAANPSKPTESSCNGDSGGPLVLKKLHNYLVGVVSWGINPCGKPNAPSVYTRVCSHFDFINRHM